MNVDGFVLRISNICCLRDMATKAPGSGGASEVSLSSLKAMSGHGIDYSGR